MLRPNFKIFAHPKLSVTVVDYHFVTMNSFTFLMHYRCQHFSGFTASYFNWRLTVLDLLGFSTSVAYNIAIPLMLT